MHLYAPCLCYPYKQPTGGVSSHKHHIASVLSFQGIQTTLFKLERLCDRVKQEQPAVYCVMANLVNRRTGVVLH